MIKDYNYNLREEIKNRRLSRVPKEYITLEKLLQTEVYNQNCFHLAAIFGELENIPKEFVTLENLRTKAAARKDCFHFAAYHGHLDQIPKEFLTLENLINKNKFDQNCLYLASLNGKLHKLPKQFLIPEYLLKKYGDMGCPLTGGVGRVDAEEDIKKTLEIIPTRKWIPYLILLKDIEERRKIEEIETLVKKIEGLNMVGEMDSLKL